VRSTIREFILGRESPSRACSSVSLGAWQSDVSEIQKTAPHARIERKLEPCAMSEAEITRQLRLYQSDPWYRGAHRRPFAALAREIGVSRDTLHAAARDAMSEATAERLAKAFTSIEAGRIRFLRRGRVWETERREPPEPLPPAQPMLVEVAAWNEWARIRFPQFGAMTNPRW
jgi:hypothetical protein